MPNKLDIREKFITQGVFGYWNSLSRAVVTAQNPREFQRFWTMLSDTWCPIQGQELDSMIMMCPFQLRCFVILWNIWNVGWKVDW